MEQLRRLLAILTVYENNFRVLHWMRGGDNFHTDHERLGGYYDQLGDFMDQIAEYLIAEGGNPVTAAEAMEIISGDNLPFIQVESGRSYAGALADEMSYMMFEQLYTATIDTIDAVQNIPTAKTVEDLLTQQSHYYYVEGRYKLGRRLNRNGGSSTTPSRTSAAAPNNIVSERPEYTNEE